MTFIHKQINKILTSVNAAPHNEKYAKHQCAFYRSFGLQALKISVTERVR